VVGNYSSWGPACAGANSLPRYSIARRGVRKFAQILAAVGAVASPPHGDSRRLGYRTRHGCPGRPMSPLQSKPMSVIQLCGTQHRMARVGVIAVHRNSPNSSWSHSLFRFPASCRTCFPSVLAYGSKRGSPGSSSPALQSAGSHDNAASAMATKCITDSLATMATELTDARKLNEQLTIVRGRMKAGDYASGLDACKSTSSARRSCDQPLIPRNSRTRSANARTA
jgi:hypothetical protein